jgi:hypothetical protein
MAVGGSLLCILNRGRCKGPAFNLSTRPPLACALRASGATRPGSRPASRSRCGRSSPDSSRHRERDGALPLIDRRLRLIQTPGSGPIREDRPLEVTAAAAAAARCSGRHSAPVETHRG